MADYDGGFVEGEVDGCGGTGLAWAVEAAVVDGCLRGVCGGEAPEF